MNKKNSLLSLLTIVMAAMLSVSITSCGGDDSPVSTPPPVPNDDNEQTDVVSNQDPEGTVVINMNNGASNNWYNIGIGNDIHIDAANNFVGFNSYTDFASVGEVSGLSKITSIPTSGWAKSAAVVPGTGYVARYRYPSSSSDPYTYARLYVVKNMVSTSGGIMGATVKYQSPFEALPIELDVTSLEFSYEVSSKRIKLKQLVRFYIAEKPEWCNATQYNDEIEVTVSENFTAEQRTGIIVLKNNVNTVTINIVQQASPFPVTGSGTANDPYNVAAAVRKCKEVGSTPSAEEYYIKGLAADDFTVPNDNYKNATFQMVDVEGASQIFITYRVLGPNGSKLKSGYTIPKGAIVIVCSKVVNYRDKTPETYYAAGYNGTLLSVNGQAPELD